MATKQYVPLFLDWIETTQDLTPEEKGNLVDAMVCYASGLEYEHLLTGGTKIAFRFMKGQIDRNMAISAVRAEARTNKTEETESNDNKTEQNESNDNKQEENTSNLLNKKQEQKTKTITKNKNENKQECAARFDRFWSAYPRKQDKAKALKAFERINPDDSMLDTMLTALEAQKRSDQWTRDGGQYIPHPTTWLNGKRWEDEVQTAQRPVKKPVAAQYSQRDYTEKELEQLADDPVIAILEGTA